jgi:hypothetical protein
MLLHEGPSYGLGEDFIVFASGPTGRIRLGPFDAVSALQEARAMDAEQWTAIRFFNAISQLELGMAEMETRFGT